MKQRRTKLLSASLVIGVLVGGWSVIPVRADEDCYPGCCNYTTDCGSPFEYRCCYPTGGEAPCSFSCGSYCYHQTSCSGG